MIRSIYNFLIFMHAVYFLGNAFAAAKFYKLQHRWSPYLAITFTGNALFALAAIITSGFGPRPAEIVPWAITIAILGRIAKVAGIIVLNLFLFGWINGVGGFAKSEAKDDPE